MEAQVEPVAGKGRSVSREHLIILLSMLLVVGALAWSTWSARALVLTFVPQVNAAMQSRVSLTEAHLWLEEIVSGDATEDPQQVWDKIGEARWYLVAMLQGGEKNGRVFVPVDDEILRTDLLAAQAKLISFEQLAHQRVDGARAVAAEAAAALAAAEVPVTSDDPAPVDPAAPVEPVHTASVGVGSDIDTLFDDTFTAYFTAMERAEDHLNEVIGRALSRYLLTQLMLAVAVVVLFLWIVWLLVRKEALERDEHVSSLQASLDHLAQSRRELEQQNALRGAMVEIADALQGIDNPAQIAQVAVDAICARSGAVVGVCWAYRPGQGLSRLATHALPAERAALTHLDDGEGLAGRVASDQQPLIVDVPSDYLPVTSGLGASAAPHLRVLPLVHDRVTAGVLELAFIDPPDAWVVELLAAAAPAIAVRLHLAGKNTA